jgi:N-methylhydantoinase A
MRAYGRVAGRSVEEVLDLARAVKPVPLVPRSRIEEVDERTIKDGTVLISVDPAAVVEAARRLVNHGCEAIAIGFLWSFVNPANEQLAAEAIRAALPSVYVTTSSEIAPRQGEYERIVAAVVNAYVGPDLERYFGRLADWLAALSFGGRLLIMTCAGGVLRTDAATRRALLTIGSGPAAGALATERLANFRGEAAAIATDMGGTTFDVSLILDGAPVRRPTTIAQQHEYFAETIDVQSLGAGGGSIASVNPLTGALHVGPRSAGSSPGPACYGLGGVDATVTDADLLLGYIDPERFLGGAQPLDVTAAEQAIEALAGRLGMPRIEVAAGIVRITDERMADLVRRMTIESGLDPRALPLYAYGGAAPLHVGAYGRSLGCATAIIPLGLLAPVWSAFGAAAADVSHVRMRGRLYSEPFDADLFWDTADELRSELERELEVDGFSPERQEISVHVEMRYAAQTHAIELPSPERRDDWARRLVEHFESLYAARYGVGAGYRAAGVELTTTKVFARGLRDLPELPGRDAGGTIVKRQRPVYWQELGGYEDTPVFDYDTLPGGVEVDGPCVIEMPTTSVVVRPGQTATLDALGNVALQLGAKVTADARELADGLVAG